MQSKIFFADKNINFKFIYSNGVFPRKFTIRYRKEKCNIVIWDKVFWKLFEWFLSALSEWNHTIEKGIICSVITSHGDIEFRPKVQIKKIISYYLSLICQDIAVESYFAKLYRVYEALNLETTYVGMSPDLIDEYLDIAKTFVAIHEYGHIYLKRNKKKRNTIQIQ